MRNKKRAGAQDHMIRSASSFLGLNVMRVLHRSFFQLSFSRGSVMGRHSTETSVKAPVILQTARVPRIRQLSLYRGFSAVIRFRTGVSPGQQT